MATLLRSRVDELPAGAPPFPRRERKNSVARFWLRVFLFWAPVLVLVGGFELLLWDSGESWSMERAGTYQERNPDALWLRGLLDQALYSYKFGNYERLRPGVVAVGTSRVMEFRAAMLGVPPADFYNLGGMVQNLGDLDTFVRFLAPGSAPRLVVLGVDMHWLNPSLPQVEGLSRVRGHDPALNWRQHVYALRSAAGAEGRRLIAAALRPRAAPSVRYIGLAARSCRCGFRADGSMEYGARLRPPGAPFVDALNPPVRTSIMEGGGRFPFASGISRPRLDSLVAMLGAMRRKGSTVVVFLPPVWSGAARALEGEPRQAGLWQEYRTLVPAAIRAAGFDVVDASTPAALGLTDAAMVDGTHGDETFYAEVSRRLLGFAGVAEAARGRAAPAPRGQP